MLDRLKDCDPVFSPTEQDEVLQLAKGCSSAHNAAAQSAELQAPKALRGNIRTHDPALIRQGGVYYVFSAGNECGLNQGSIQIRKSSNLSQWDLVGTVFEAIPSWVSQALGRPPLNLWAPDIACVNGQFGLATNNTLDPQSSDYRWVDQGLVIQSTRSNNWNAIDPSLSVDVDDAHWLVYHIYNAALDGRPELRIRDLTWTIDGWPELRPAA